MKILRIVRTLDKRSGGVIEAASQYAKGLFSTGHVTHFLTLDKPGSVFEKDFGHRIISAAGGRGKYGYSPRLASWIEVHAKDYDVVIVDGLWQYQGLAAWIALRHSRVPYVVHTHGMLDPWFARNYPLKHLKKYIYWLLFEHRILRDARAVIFTTEEERMLSRNAFLPYKFNDYVVPYGITPPPADSRSRADIFLAAYPQLRGKRTILFLGRIHPKKGCDILIKAFSNIGRLDARLCLVMAGPDEVGWRGRLESMAESLRLKDRIVWTGMLEGEMKWGAFNSSEVFILPSHQENFGISVAEACACGLPVLISDKINIWREIKEAGAGIVDADIVGGTERMLKKWLDMKTGERELMGRNAQKCFNDNFELGKATRILLQALKNNGIPDNA